MRDLKEIFKNGEKMSQEEMMRAIAELQDAKRSGRTADVMGVQISISPVGVDAHVTMNGELIRRFGLQDAVDRFTEEIKPIVEKYSGIVSQKYREDFKKFVRGATPQ